MVLIANASEKALSSKTEKTARFYTVLKLAMQHTFSRVRICPRNRPLENPSRTSHALPAPHTLCGRALAQHMLQVIAAQGDNATRVRVRVSAHSPLAGTALRGCAAAGPCKSAALDSVHHIQQFLCLSLVLVLVRYSSARAVGTLVLVVSEKQCVRVCRVWRCHSEY